MGILELKNRWQQEKEAFKNKEIGELQDFIKEVLKEKELFGLAQGHLSTQDEVRKNEFTIETRKKSRRADFVIYIDGKTIIIPVEVERYKNIDKGIHQILQYQKDWNKIYGILTDGEEWRFYYANKYKKFSIQQMLSNSLDFCIYWKSYIQPQNYYQKAFSYSTELIDEKIDLTNKSSLGIFFEDITEVIKKFKVKMKAIGAFEAIQEKNKKVTNFLESREYEKVVVEISYAYLIQFILYKVLVDNGYRQFSANYRKIIEKIQKSLVDKNYFSLIINEIKNISEYISEKIYKPFANEQKIISEKIKENLKQSKDLSVEEVAPWLDIILFIHRYNFSGLKNEIFGFIYENFLKDLYADKKNKGQYFTDPAVVNFMLQEIGYNEENIKKQVNKNQISIIDPSCGAGTFLYSAVDKIINAFDEGSEEQSKWIEGIVDKNIFGLDIEEFPLYLAEMNILMRLLPLVVNDDYENPINKKIKIFKTNDSIAEFLIIDINRKENERFNFGKPSEQKSLFSQLEETALDYPSFMRDEEDLREMLKSLRENGLKREKFDYVIGNPPYIGYNECCKQKLVFTQKIADKNDSYITMGNVYNVNLHSIPDNHKKYGPKPNLYAFFIALGLALLKDNAKMAYIIPQTILTAKDLDVLRYHLAYFTTIEKIITFEGKMFIGRGLKQNKPVATSSLIFVVQNSKPDKNNSIQITNYKPYTEKQEGDFEKYIFSKNKTTEKITQKKLQENIANWNFIKDKLLLSFYKSYKNKTEDIACYYEHKVSENLFGEIFFFDGGLVFEKNKSSCQGDWSLIKKNKVGYKPIIREKYIENKFIRIPQGSQGLDLFYKAYKIVWQYMNFDKFYFTDKKIMLEFNWVIIASNNKTEIFYLFSLLNSTLNIFLLKKLLTIPNEKNILLGIRAIKEFVRIPKINEENNFIKKEIIKQTEKLLSLEDLQLKDFVAITTSIQKFKQVTVEKDKLLLTDLQDKKISFQISQKVAFIKELIKATYPKELEPIKVITLQELKHLPAIDKKEQAKIKNYIDDLIFALYFEIIPKKIGIQYAHQLKEQCSQGEFYQYLNILPK